MSNPKTPAELAKERSHARSRAMAQAVVSAFSAKLKTEARKHGGFIGLRHLDALDSEFQSKAEELADVFDQAFQEAHREQEELKWHAIKRPPFDRLIVKRFENMLMAQGEDGRMRGKLSRRMLPGFFLALNMMLGPEVMHTFQRRCEQALDRVMGGRVPVDWELVNADRDVCDVMLDAEYTISQYFEDPRQRADWFLHIVNSNLAPISNPKAHDAHWELDRATLAEMVENLLKDLMNTVNDDIAWAHLAVRHQEADREYMREILERLK